MTTGRPRGPVPARNGRGRPHRTTATTPEPGARARWRFAVAAVVGLLTPLAAPGVPADAAAPCATPAGVYQDAVGWAQRLTDPTRIWPLTDGAGQLVAVLGTGIDADNPQFGPGQVAGASDRTDCDGRGTFAAGIVGARPDPATTFAGLAPGARILALRYTETTDGAAGSGDGPDPDDLAEAVRRATDAGAGVILVVVPAVRSSRALESAVREALAEEIVVVAPAVAARAGLRSYPAALPGVLGVGAHDQAGSPVQTEAGGHVTLAAPGADLVSTAAGTRGRIGQRWGVGDPAYAAAYVAGTVALIRAYRPELSPAQVRERLAATANRPPYGRDPRLGWGRLDVAAAVTAELPAGPAPGRAAAAAPQVVEPAVGPTRPPARPRLPGVLALLGLVGAVLAGLAVTVLRRGRARGWRR
ncbi:S8 family serine peptidase [Plantactinospora sp. B5E13]|uniref:S8 family serine peptidase n=1 Tax=unclassified Plantactinospora TaxID=2631981 RepID=UPI00325D546C